MDGKFKRTARGARSEQPRTQAVPFESPGRNVLALLGKVKRNIHDERYKPGMVKAR